MLYSEQYFGNILLKVSEMTFSFFIILDSEIKIFLIFNCPDILARYCLHNYTLSSAASMYVIVIHESS